jgi:hypothetical protein
LTSNTNATGSSTLVARNNHRRRRTERLSRTARDRPEASAASVSPHGLGTEFESAPVGCGSEDNGDRSSLVVSLAVIERRPRTCREC